MEKTLGSQLPSDYREFLLQYNGGVPETNEFTIADTNNASGVNEFMGVEGIESQKRILGDRFPDNVVPIAYAEGGNLVCIALVGNDRGKVYFWDHELKAGSGDISSWENMFLIASSFRQFWELLRRFDPSQVQLDPDQVKSVWIDPDFLDNEAK